MKEEALKLADELDEVYSPPLQIASAMIRRLVEELDNNKLRNSDNPFAKALRNAEALKIKPLSDEEIKQIFADQTGYYIDSGLVKGLAVMDFARAIEERHGIK